MRSISYHPSIVPHAVPIGQKLEYSNDSPGSIVGVCPITPSPSTDRAVPSASTIVQWRAHNRSASAPRFSIRIRYENVHTPSDGSECSGRYVGVARTSTPCVVANDPNLAPVSTISQR